MSRRNFLLLACFLGPLYILRLKTFKKPEFTPGQKVQITARLSQEPNFSSSRQIFSLAGIKISTWHYPEYHFGDKLRVKGEVGKDGLINPEIEKIGESEGVLSRLSRLKRKIGNF